MPHPPLRTGMLLDQTDTIDVRCSFAFHPICFKVRSYENRFVSTVVSCVFSVYSRSLLIVFRHGWFAFISISIACWLTQIRIIIKWKMPQTQNQMQTNLINSMDDFWSYLFSVSQYSEDFPNKSVEIVCSMDWDFRISFVLCSSICFNSRWSVSIHAWNSIKL